MDEIIRIKGEGYAEYENLLLRRDKLRKEACIWQKKYMAEFGDMVIRLFEIKISCIKKKKTISFCQAALNCGKPIDQGKLQEYLSQEMQQYNQHLAEMIRENEIAQSMERISADTASKIKKLYRKLAKMVHPDINPKTNEIPELKSLWNMISVSYNANDLQELEDAEILVNKFLADAGLSGAEIEIHDVQKKIEQINGQIQKIKGTNPYQYKFLLQDKELVEKKKMELKEELHEYEDYEKKLDRMLEQMMEDGVSFVWHMNWK